MKLKFRTAFERGETTNSEIGSRFMPEYGYRYDTKTGKRIVIQTGETNLYEKIQASLEASKIENIIARATAGDYSGLMKNEGQYVDLTEMPSNLMEMQNLIIAAQDSFYDMPIELRNKFNNNPQQFIAEYGTKEWAEKMGYTVNETPIPNERIATKQIEIGGEKENERSNETLLK